MTKHSFNIKRVGPPTKPSQGDLHAIYGHQWEWGWGLPEVLRAIASPATFTRIPQRPAAEEPIEHVVGYWFPLLYVLVHRLGWEDPGAGLREWYDRGLPTDDPTLAIVQQVWGPTASSTKQWRGLASRG